MSSKSTYGPCIVYSLYASVESSFVELNVHFNALYGGRSKERTNNGGRASSVILRDRPSHDSSLLRSLIMKTDSSTRISKIVSFSSFCSHSLMMFSSSELNKLSSSLTSLRNRFSNTAFTIGSSFSACRRMLMLNSVLYKLPRMTEYTFDKSTCHKKNVRAGFLSALRGTS